MLFLYEFGIKLGIGPKQELTEELGPTHQHETWQTAGFSISQSAEQDILEQSQQLNSPRLLPTMGTEAGEP